MSQTTTRTMDLQQVVSLGTPKAVDLWLEVTPDPGDRTAALAELSPQTLAAFVALLDAETGVDLLDSVEEEVGAELLAAAGPEKSALLLDALDSDRAAALLREFDAPDIQAALAGLSADRSSVLRALLAWPETSAAAHMVPETLTVAAAMTAVEAVEAVRSHSSRVRSDSRTGAYVYVVDPENRLLGVVPFRNLVLAAPNDTVATLMEDDVITVGPLTDQEEAAQTLVHHRLVAIPVVDTDRRLLGIITADDAVAIALDEATEDAEKQGGSEPLDVPYLRASPWLLWRKRIIWLLVLFIAEAYTGTVLRLFEDELEAVVALAFFIPLLIGTGGNTGTQITSTLVRAMATGQVRMRDLPKVVAKELTTGSMIAVTMAVVALIRAWTLGVGLEVMLVVSISVALIVLWSALISSVLPLVLKKLRVDPAVVSAPMIATIVDGTGLMIYFLTAKLLLPELAGL